MNAMPVVIVLALGPMLRWARRPGQASALTHSVDLAIASELPVLVVTTTAMADDVIHLVARRDVLALGTPSAASSAIGLGEAIAAGVAARASASGWLLLPAEVMSVQPQTLRRVASALSSHAVVYAQHRGRQGHPVAFGAELFSDLVRLSGNEGPRRLLARYPAHGVEVADPGVLLQAESQPLRSLSA